jgi:hypothetical protein
VPDRDPFARATPLDAAERAALAEFDRRWFGTEPFSPDSLTAEEACRALTLALRDRAALLAALDRIDQTLRIPAAEYVPAIGDVFREIDRALGR